MDDLRKALPAKDNSLYIRYLRDLLTNPASQDYADYLISNFENDAEKDVILSKLLTKIGPVLGLIGTLIAMSRRSWDSRRATSQVCPTICRSYSPRRSWAS